MSDTLDAPAQPEPSAPTAAGTDQLEPVSPAMRALLAALSIGAGAIHMVMVPSHSQASLVEGIGFALAGWFQVAFGIALLARPQRLWLKLGIAANLVFIAVWALSRTAGLPFGAHAGHPESVSSIDLLCVAFEAGIIVGSVAALVFPGLLAKLSKPALAVGSVVPVGILLATTMAMASPEAANHSANGHDHGTEVAAGAGMDHSHGAMDHGNATAADGHDHAHDASAVPASARCDWDLNTQAFWQQNPPAKDDHAAGSHDDHSHASGAGEGQGNQHGVQAWTPLTDKAKCDELRADIKTMEEVARRYPTAADAKAAGCVQVTIYVTGIASHWACFKNWDGKLDIQNPEMLLYGGSSLQAPIVGLSYYSLAKDAPQSDPNAPLWVRYMPTHYHQGLCVKGALVIGGDNSTKEKCEAAGGRVQGKTGWMGHYWLNTCDSPDGVFSADNPRLDIGVANVNDEPSAAADPAKLQADPCAGSKMKGAPGSTFGPPSTVGATGSGEQAAGR